MIVQAIHNQQEDIPSDIRHYSFEGAEDNLPLTIGGDYVVAGLRYTLGHEFYLIVSNDGRPTCSPWWYPKEIFKVVDSKIPSGWQWGGDDVDKVHTFPELAEGYTKGNMFQSQLEDGEESALSVFKSYYDLYSQHDER